MRGPIGYYVHHHGDGHRQRALAIAHAAGQGSLTLIGTGLDGRTDGHPCLDLPDDRLAARTAFDGSDNAAERPQALHYAPVHHDGIRDRTALLTNWIARERPSLIVVDVSVEIAMLARLAATPTVYVRLAGPRGDVAHFDAYRGASAILAPFPAELDDPGTPAWIHAKTCFCPGLTPVSRFADAPQSDTVLVVFGTGGNGGDGEVLAAAARATPQMNWRAIGPVSQPQSTPDNLELLGWVENADAEIAAAGIVVGGAGDGLVNAMIAAGRRFICLPEPRPFDEQVAKASRLAELGAAIVVERWPNASEWPALIARARDLEPDILRRLDDPNGARHAADFLLTTARQNRPQ